MIKFIIGLIAVILIGLSISAYTEKNTEASHSFKVTQKVSQQKIAKQEKIEVVKDVSISAKQVVKLDSSKKDLVVQVSSPHEEATTNLEDTVGENLTLESIEYAESEEEKIRIRDDLAYNQSLQVKTEPTLSEEEIFNIIEEDLNSN